MVPDMPGNIRVFVRWHEPTVFSGEEVRCTITFKNVAPTPSQQSSLGEKSRFPSSLHNRVTKASAGLTPSPSAASVRAHRRSPLSLSLPPSSSRVSPGSLQWPQSASLEGRSGHVHKRSVSIVSIGSATTVEDAGQRSEGLSRQQPPQRPARGHNRATSLQALPRSHMSPPLGSGLGGFSPRPSLPSVFNSSYPPSRFGKDESPSVSSNVSETPDRRKSSTKHDASPTLMPEFRFPAAPSPPSDASQLQQRQPEDGLLSPKNHSNILLRQKIQAGGGAAEKRQAPAARIISSTGTAGGTPRSSGEFYSISNHSSETLASEYVSQSHTRERHPAHLRRSSGLSSLQADGPESLMMGYAQFHGSFSLDGSLIDLTPFEQVKKKAAVGGRGGGVVGLESTKRESGLLRGFGWGSISTSLNDLLGGGDLSTIKEMREVASSKSVPLLSTPQSILFVDLQLAPGESRSFEYSFNLPRGLPPTHKGKAIKLSYSIVIGTQRAGGAKEQQIRTVEIPLRILGSVNSHGEVLGHDLMHPYIFLTNEARVKTAGKVTKTERKNEAEKSRATLKDFLTYVDELVSRPRGNTGDTIPAPSDLAGSRRPSTFDETLHANEAIHRAIMRSNMTTENQQSANRFEIARNGQRVGTVMLTRPAYRLGEVITIAIDFADSEVPCYAVHATLETSERVDPSLAVRSESSIQRVTRKVYVTWSQSTLFARRVVFTPSIPISATPEFTTSGVSLEWKIRVEFVMPSQGSESPRYESGPHPLLEQLSQDEKGGLVLAAAENLLCESFDVTVPLRVYGTLGTGLERLERDEASEEGLVI